MLQLNIYASIENTGEQQYHQPRSKVLQEEVDPKPNSSVTGCS